MPTKSDRLVRSGTIQWVPVEKMRVSPMAQRILRPAFVDYLVSEFDPDQIGYPLLSHRDGWYYVVDGQHRIDAVRKMGWGDQMVECEVREGLTEAEEAEEFLRRNDRLNVSLNEKFKVSLTSGRQAEVEIDAVLKRNGYHIIGTTENYGDSGSRGDTSATNSTPLRCIAALRNIHAAGGVRHLDRVLKFVNAAFVQEDSANIFKGVGLFLFRYDGVDDAVAADRLAKARGGSRGLIQRATGLRRATGESMGNCVAAAIVDTYNAGRGGVKLPNWWR